MARFKNPWVIAGAVLGVLVFIGLCLFVWQVVTATIALQRGEDPFRQSRLDASVTRLLAQTPIKDTDLSRLEAGTNPMLGNPEAKIRIVEFLDYQCPFSQDSAAAVRAFMARHPNDVALMVRDFPLESIHENALDASIAARCVFTQGDVNRFWNYHDQLFRYQESLSPALLRSLAAGVGAAMDAFDECLSNGAQEKAVRVSLEDGLKAGVRGTPTFFVNGIRVAGSLDLAALETIYERLTVQKE